MAVIPPQVILLGPPGVGKGTQAQRLAGRLNLVHVAPGRIVRERAAADSPEAERIRELMAAGELLPDELIDELVRECLGSLAPNQGFVLDGYPRTPAEARSLRQTLAELGRLRRRTVVVWLQAPREELVRRLRLRRAEEDRPDDSEEALVRRLEIYQSQAEALSKALQDFADQASVDGTQPADAITEQIIALACGPGGLSKLRDGQRAR